METNIAVVGAGLVGQRHIKLASEHAKLAAIIDPSPMAKGLARQFDTPWFSDLDEYLSDHRPDGVIVATPNQLHVSHGIACVEAGVPALIEKPIADTAAGATELVKASEAARVPILIGHHRRHNPLIRAARQVIDGGKLGDVVSMTAQFWLYKPDDYFDADWRKQDGAGPVFINLIHDIDLIRYLCGEVVAVQAMDSRRARSHAVEDTAAVLLEFENGALGTVSVSDTVSAPWSWEFTTGENPVYPNVQTSCYRIGGTHASLSIPDMKLWFHPGKRSWWEPIDSTVIDLEPQDPLVLQLQHFVDVIRGTAEPIVSSDEGLKTLQVVEAIKNAAKTRTLQHP